MDCLFCKIVNKEIPSKMIYEDDYVSVFMDINPTCDGHTLVVPKKHFTDVFELDKDTLHHMYDVTHKISNIITEVLNLDGCSYVFNYGSKQAIKHVHLHITPDYTQLPKLDINDVYNKIMEKING